MAPNLLLIGACAFIPFFIAYAWFHSEVFGGSVWQEVAQLTDAQNAKAIKPWQLLVSIVLNFFLAFGIFIVTVHSTHVVGMLGGDVEAVKNSASAVAFLKEHGATYTTFSHGISHGLFLGFLAFILPILGYSVIFERKSFNYLLINGGFWALSLTLMACISKWVECQFFKAF